VYVPAVLVDGMIAPVIELIVKPAGAVKVPPVVPVKLTGCAPVTERQNGFPG
jgi:hypothetical protein